ncbi:tetratricopeptide repeat protein [Methylomonas sp. AM2-LC]|uniref:tetratricopeptide repeat protein n=1 Tax=Methylomonas sp. AM2-LC TaxID=3153301 RepID=UPI0032664B81
MRLALNLMIKRISLPLLVPLVVLPGCAAAPQITATPGPGKSAAAFDGDDKYCKPLAFQSPDKVSVYTNCMRQRGNYVQPIPGAFKPNPNATTQNSPSHLKQQNATASANQTNPEPPTACNFNSSGHIAFQQRDYAQALQLLQNSSSQGDLCAETTLGLMYSSGNGVPVDQQHAMQLWLDAANKGNHNAAYILGITYGYGNSGQPIDAAEACKWYEKAGLSPIEAQERVVKDKAAAQRMADLAAQSNDNISSKNAHDVNTNVNLHQQTLANATKPVNAENKEQQEQKMLTKLLNEVLTDDSKSWVLNHYDHDSVSNAKILAGSLASGTYQVRGDYNYNSGKSGWFMVSVEHNKEHCLTYFDFPGVCRKPRDLNILVKGIAALAVLSAASGGGHSGSDYSYSANTTNNTSETTAKQWNEPENEYFSYTNPRYKNAGVGYEDATNNPYGQPPSNASDAYKNGFNAGQMNEFFRRNTSSSEHSDE